MKNYNVTIVELDGSADLHTGCSLRAYCLTGSSRESLDNDSQFLFRCASLKSSRIIPHLSLSLVPQHPLPSSSKTIPHSPLPTQIS